MATSTVIFFLGLGGLLILGQLQRIEIFPWPAFYLHDLLMLVWASWLVVSKKRVLFELLKKVLNKKYWFIWLLATWVLIGWLVSIVGGDFSFKAILYTLRFLVYSWVIFRLGKSKDLKSSLVRVGLLAIGFWLLFGGLGQYLFLPDMRFLSIFGWDDHYFRLVGTQFDPNFMGVILVLLFLNSQFLVVNSKYKKHIFCFRILLLLGLALTFSRSAFLSFVISQVFLLRFQIKKYWPVLVLAMLILMVPKPAGEGVVLTRTASIEARLNTSQQNIANLEGWRWLVGHGLFNSTKETYAKDIYSRADHAALPDNLFLMILEGTGAVGLILTLIVALKMAIYLAKKYPRANIFLLAVLTHAMFNNSLFQPFVFIILGLSLVGEIDD